MDSGARQIALKQRNGSPKIFSPRWILALAKLLKNKWIGAQKISSPKMGSGARQNASKTKEWEPKENVLSKMDPGARQNAL